MPAPPRADHPAADEPLTREVYVVAAVVVVGVIMSILDTTIVNVALDTLSRELDAPLDTIQWVTTGYLLALATVIPLTGWMSERFGAKKVYMTSVLLFGLGSALCGLAWSAESLIVFRVLQGFGGGMIMPVGMIVLAQIAGPHRIGRVMSVVGIPMLLGPILGPVIGGVIVDNTSWEWIFYVNLPIAALGLVLAQRFLTSDQGKADAGQLDWLGLALLSPGLVGIIFGLSESESQGGFVHPIVLGPIVVGALLIAAFIRHAWFAERPLIDVRLFRDRTVAAASALSFLVGGSLFGAMIVLPLYYQVARGESALDAGLLMAPQGLGAAMAMPIAGRLTDRIGGGRVALFGIVVATIGTIPYAFVGADSAYSWLGGVLVVRGIGIGCTMMPAMAAAYAVLAPRDIPRATSALNVIRQVGGSLGTAILAVILQGHISDAREQGQPVAEAFGSTFWWAVGMTTVALVPAVILARAPRGRPPAAAQERAPESPPTEALAAGSG